MKGPTMVPAATLSAFVCTRTFFAICSFRIGPFGRRKPCRPSTTTFGPEAVQSTHYFFFLQSNVLSITTDRPYQRPELAGYPMEILFCTLIKERAEGPMTITITTQHTTTKAQVPKKQRNTLR